jgi:hypothetical protein
MTGSSHQKCEGISLPWKSAFKDNWLPELAKAADRKDDWSKAIEDACDSLEDQNPDHARPLREVKKHLLELAKSAPAR